MEKNLSKKIYTSRTTLYHFFVFLVGYTGGVKKFFLSSDYLHNNIKILDAGCGGGLVTKILYKLAKQKQLQNVTLQGFDLTPAMLKYAQKWIDKENAPIQLAQADVLKPEQLPSDWHNYDLITVSGMLEHLPKDLITQAIHNLKQLIKPNGKLIIFICRTNSLSYWIIEKWWKANTYTRNEIETIMRNAGFTTFKFKKFPFPYGYLNSWVHIIEA